LVEDREESDDKREIPCRTPKQDHIGAGSTE